MDPNEPLIYAYSSYLNGLLGNLEACRSASARAIALDPLSLFIRAVAVMGFPVVGIPGADSAAALESHQAALATDPNSVLHLWMAGVRLGDCSRFDEAVRLMQHAVELTQRAPLIVGLYARALTFAGGRHEALALRDELRERAKHEYVGPAAFLMMVSLDLDDEEATRASGDVQAGTQVTRTASSPTWSLETTRSDGREPAK